MSDPQPSSPIQSESKEKKSLEDNHNSNSNSNSNANNNIVRRERPARECTKRAAARLQAAAAAEAEAAATVRKRKASVRKERLAARLLREEEDEEEFGEEGDDEEEGAEGENGLPSSRQQCSKIVTQLVGEPEPSQLPRWNLRGMWQLASILNFLNVFRPLLNVKVEFSAEEFETALISPNDTLGDIHMPLLKAIPPVARVALGHNTWITVLCRKLRDWWHWVAEGELPIVASQGAEIEAYYALDPAVRVVILKAICDIRVEQEDIRNYIDDSLKQGVHLSLFRKDRIGGDSHGISYWYEDDPIIGHRLYREIRKVEVKKGKGKNVQPIPSSCYQWETVATNFDEFQDVSEKLFSSQNRTEASVGKKLKNNMLPEIEKVHRRKEKLLKKQHRQALMLDNMLHIDGLAGGRSLRDRKPVTYTFDDYDRSISDAIKITKKNQSSPEPNLRREAGIKHEASTNGRLGSPSHSYQRVSFRVRSPKSPEYDEYDDEDHNDELLDRSNRTRQRPQRYSAREFVEEISEHEADSDSDDDIVGEVVYDDDYVRKRKPKMSSSSEGDDEYRWDEENPEDEEEEDEDEQDSPSASEESDQPRKFRKLPGRTRRETKLRSSRSGGNLQSGLRRSNRATRNRINYSHYELSESETESMQPEKSNGSDEHYDDASDNAEFSMASEGTEENNDDQEVKAEQPVDVPSQMETADENNGPKRTSSPDQDDVESGGKRRFLDLNQLAPGSGFDDGPNSVMKDEGADDF